MAEAQPCREATAASLLSITLSPLLRIVNSQEADCFQKTSKKCFTSVKNERTMTSMVGVDEAMGADSLDPTGE